MSQDPMSPGPPPPPDNPYAPPSSPVGGGGAGGGGGGQLLPWDERSRLGFLEALVQTVKLVVTEPKDAFARVRTDGDYVGPLIFAVIIGWVMAIIGQIWQLAFGGLFNAAMLGGMGGDVDLESFGMMAGGGIMQLVITIFIAPFIVAVVMFIYSGILHLCLMLVGGVGQSQAGYEGTFKVLAYAQVAQLAQIVPFVGGFIALVWQIVLLVFGFQAVHRTSQGKSVIAALLPLILCCVCVAVLVFAFGAAIFSAAAGANAG